ncbi:MAG: SMC-Scp complex subunit ScpB [Acidobacteriota bacterium]
MSDPAEFQLEAKIEALLFASADPLTAREVGQALPEADPEQIEKALERLAREYAGPGGGLQVSRAAGGYRITTRPEFAPVLERLFQTRNRSRLSKAALETLAVIAYRQPITGPEIQEIRGVGSQGVLKNLLERRQVRILGRKAVVGRPLLYGTTRDFLLHFGLNSLSDLPEIEEMQELGAAAPAPPEGVVVELDKAEASPEPGATDTSGNRPS